MCLKLSQDRLRGFTLIEMSIVLVVIGLIVGGVLVGQELIRAAGVRATITQVERFNTAANTFYEKYRFLPGDIMAVPAAQFGFAPRGQYAGEGDGNGFIEGNSANGPGDNVGYVYVMGETIMFWADLSTAGLIDGSFTLASSTASTGTVTPNSTPALSAYFPQAKLGKGNYIYVTSVPQNASGNHLGIAGISTLGNPSGCNGCILTTPNLTVAEAYSIDSKIDDGNGYSGRVVSGHLNPYPSWSPYSASGSATSCTNYGGVYSIQFNGGAGVNCALQIRMQAGD